MNPRTPDLIAPDATCLLFMLGGTARIIDNYDITHRDDPEAVAGVLWSAMEANDVGADLAVVAEAVAKVRAVVQARRLPFLVPESAFERFNKMTAVEAATEIDPLGTYTMVKTQRMA